MLSLKISIVFTSLIVLLGSVFVSNAYSQVSDSSGIIVGRQADVFGLVDIDSDGHKLNIDGVVNYIPPTDKVFEVWLYDGNYRASGYPLSVGVVKDDGSFSLKSTQVNAYTYTELFVTMEPKDDKDPKPAFSNQVGLYVLPPPFGQ
jgi:hypothetical protein